MKYCLEIFEMEIITNLKHIDNITTINRSKQIKSFGTEYSICYVHLEEVDFPDSFGLLFVRPKAPNFELTAIFFSVDTNRP